MSRKKSIENEPLPFTELKRFTKTYPNVWSTCDMFHNNNGKNGLPPWNKLCEVQISATLSIMTKYPRTTIDKMFPAECAALYAWRKHKIIYKFDKDLAKMLMEQAEDLEVPLDVLYSLPYPCIYIELDENVGFFVWFEDDYYTHVMELRMFILRRNADGTVSHNENIILHLKEGWNISDGVRDTVKTIQHNLNDKEIQKQVKEFGFTSDKSDPDKQFEVQYIMASSLIQLVLYICAENKDVQENEEQKSISKPFNKEKPKDVFREIRKWDVGYRVGNVIRKANETSESSSASEHSNVGHGSSVGKRPHSRRGHYHHYWVGSKKDGTRRIILKWVAPMFINGDIDDIIPTTYELKGGNVQ
jgi:hypothetical protein